jgi:hypothetical protein
MLFGWISTALQSSAASPSQMGRFETQWLAAPENFAALADLSGQWIDLGHGRRPPRGIVLDMDSNQNSWTAHRGGACRMLVVGRTQPAGSRIASAQAQRDYFQECVAKRGNM